MISEYFLLRPGGEEDGQRGEGRVKVVPVLLSFH